jgi:hypothetical protein
MAPTCYTMKNLHYRTQSLPESVHQYNHLLAAQLGSGHRPEYGLQMHPGKLHSASAIKKRAALRRSQTSVADLMPHGVTHHRAPLAQGVYEAFLPPPNFNSIGLPTGAQLSCGMSMNRARSRTQSFYVPSHYMAPSSSHQLLPSSPYPSLHHSQASLLGMEQCPGSLGPQWYHRSVPNLHPRSLPYLPQPALPQPGPPAKSITTPLFVDCSVEYDLGEQPVIPADSAPLLSIHPEYVARSLNSSPYSLPHSAPSQRPSPLAGSSTTKSMPETASLRVQRRSQPRASPLRSRPSPRARASLAAKLEATRKLSVESRDSGIGLMASAGTLSSYPQGYPSSSPTDPQAFLQTHQQTQFTGKLHSNKRFAITGSHDFLLSPAHDIWWRCKVRAVLLNREL